MAKIGLKAPMRSLTLAICTAVLSGCVAYADPYGSPGHSATVQIPPGHMPPPGSCRVWFPDRPPGQQPPPGRCEALRYQVPPGAFLVYGR